MSSDRKIPLSLLNQVTPIQDIIISSCIIVDGQLNPDVLRDSLTELVDRWPLLGSRVAQIKSTVPVTHELCVPAAFSDTRPRFIFTTAENTEPYTKTPSRKARFNPAIQSSILDDFRVPTTPRGAKDLLDTDLPILHVHVNCFSNVTCIGLHIPHVCADVPGLSIVLRAWCSLISAHGTSMDQIQLPPLIEEDPLAEFGEPYPKDAHALARFRKDMLASLTVLGFWASLIYFVRLAFNIVMGKEEVRLLFIPESVVKKEREAILCDTTTSEKIWVSDNDVLTALIVKMGLYSRAPTQQAFTVAFTANLRGQIPQLDKDKGQRFLQNSLVAMCGKAIPLAKAKTMSVADLALHIRDTINTQRNVTQLSKAVTIHRENARLGKFVAYCPADGTNFYTTSWLIGKWTDLDFRGALKDGEVRHDGRVVFAGGFATVADYGVAGRSRWAVIMSKVEAHGEEEGGYWCEFGAKINVWPEIEKYVATW